MAGAVTGGILAALPLSLSRPSSVIAFLSSAPELHRSARQAQVINNLGEGAQCAHLTQQQGQTQSPH